jgi:hypothetical protein
VLTWFATIILAGASPVAIALAFTAINVLQNGKRKWDGRGVEQILGKPARDATPEDIDGLSKRDVMQLFYAAEAPGLASMKGEYRARLVPVGVAAIANHLYAHRLMGPGHWEAKAFYPFGDDRAWGYNIFTSGKGARARQIRTMKMDTFVGRSRFDEKDSFHLVYAAHSKGRNRSMRDEIRKINDGLFIAVGCLGWNLDTLNPCPFVLYGEPAPWKGPDAQ